MNWTQPICEICYDLRYPGRLPTTLLPSHRETELCCDCGFTTTSGIYVRVDPRTVEYPAPDRG